MALTSLTDAAMEILDEHLSWLFYGGVKEESWLALYRTEIDGTFGKQRAHAEAFRARTPANRIFNICDPTCWSQLDAAWSELHGRSQP